MDKGEFNRSRSPLRRRQDTSLRRRVGLELQGKRIAREGAAVTAAGKESPCHGGPGTHLGLALAMATSIRLRALGPRSKSMSGATPAARVVRVPFYKAKVSRGGASTLTPGLSDTTPPA